METTLRRVRRRQRISDSLIVTNNSISASEAKEVGFNDMMNNFVLGKGRRRRIVIARNEIKSDKSWSVGIGNLFNNYCNLSVVIFLLLLVVAALILLGFCTQRETRPTTLLTQGEMSRLTIMIKYDGRWVNSMYENCKTKRVLVSDKITLEELQKKVYNIVNVDPNEYEITMKVIYEVMKTELPIEIADDDDVRAFIFESLSSSYKIPLCITLKGKVSNQQAPSIDVS
ncbi:PREDICTED: uncharacterized protein LOC103332086 [Prunus mume]|uniref:Uncharacterized protein LOC103332086 n=1 Tax=Prunus mume TaxID=102107 RepID=A0ABM0P1D6_PRUMU|nr:PREDICTED: uncharacterized protein LOC103332086 [Prunus mume]